MEHQGVLGDLAKRKASIALYERWCAVTVAFVVALFDGSIQPDIKFALPLMCTAASATTEGRHERDHETYAPAGPINLQVLTEYGFKFSTHRMDAISIALTLQNIMDTTLLEVLRMGIITRTVTSRDSHKALNKLLNAPVRGHE